MTPTQPQLSGLSVVQAEKYAGYHINAWYTQAEGDSYEHSGRCAICGKPATNVHHEPAKGIGGGRRYFTLKSEYGLPICDGSPLPPVRPTLIALCGSGTDGCHGLIHQGKLHLEWRWNVPSYSYGWWSGAFLAMFGEHSEQMKRFGHWVLRDNHGNERAL